MLKPPPKLKAGNGIWEVCSTNEISERLRSSTPSLGMDTFPPSADEAREPIMMNKNTHLMICTVMRPHTTARSIFAKSRIYTVIT